MHLDDFNLDVEPSGSVSPRGLRVVDDSKIRKEIFATSKNLLKKINKLEKDHASFLSYDQLLYQDWYNVTFRKELQAVEKLEKRFRALSTFQVHLNHVAKTSQVSVEQAYVMLKQEETQYQNGDEGWRFVIENLRQQRYANATKASVKPPTAAMNRSEEQYVKEVILNLEDMLRSDDSFLSGLKRYARSLYHYLNEIDDGMMARHLADSVAGYHLFKESFQIAMKCGDWKLLGRIWRTGGPLYQQRLLRPMPGHLKDFLLQMFAENEAEQAAASENPEAEIILRSSYRKLARLLHPDMQSGQLSLEFQEWASKKWQKVQAAYVAEDHEALKGLEIVCLAELGHLNHLTTNEIYQSSLILADELESLKISLKLYRKHPAWKFSARRKYDALTVKIRRELKERFTPLHEQVLSLEGMIRKLAKETKGQQT